MPPSAQLLKGCASVNRLSTEVFYFALTNVGCRTHHKYLILFVYLTLNQIRVLAEFVPILDGRHAPDAVKQRDSLLNRADNSRIGKRPSQAGTRLRYVTFTRRDSRRYGSHKAALISTFLMLPSNKP